MRRRDLAIVLCSGLLSARPLRAQQKTIPVIGWLSGSSAGASASIVAAFRQGLNEIGFVEGQNVAIEYRWAEGHYDRLPDLAADLVGRKVDVIATGGGTNSTLAARDATATIPIVFGVSGNPVEMGLVPSFARPGGNLTGLSNVNAGLTPKRLELLSELVPQAKVMALLVNPNASPTVRIIGEAQEAARAKKLQIHILERFPLGLNRDFQGVRKGGVLAGDSVSGMRFAAASVSSCDGCPPKWRQILRSCRIYCNMIGIRSSVPTLTLRSLHRRAAPQLSALRPGRA
jgi:hypothetical protein